MRVIIKKYIDRMKRNSHPITIKSELTSMTCSDRKSTVQTHRFNRLAHDFGQILCYFALYLLQKKTKMLA